MLHDKCATIKMEEGYMRMTIEYTGLESRSLICDEIGKVEDYPEYFLQEQIMKNLALKRKLINVFSFVFIFKIG